MGDMKAKVGNDNTDKGHIMGKHGVGNCNENDELLKDFCLFNDLVVGGTVFPHKTIHKTTWTSLDGHTENQIDHITINRQFRRSLLDVRVKRGADVATDHHLLVATMKIKLRSFHDTSDRPHHKFNVLFLREHRKQKARNNGQPLDRITRDLEDCLHTRSEEKTENSTKKG
ncbi:hypothetical protein C0Q70_15803 [Pomacea canaliculata]|uniref:Endonuclease/exonuclease/phosphatase domain-containing protein n=1 Tax=Pomacea canaliculata TaxID=400727 RepID=A0A2T7NVW5_POMCA|nr:hypothetical protein C0Q70_15803 [Pomacea canaliculata]